MWQGATGKEEIKSISTETLSSVEALKEDKSGTLAALDSFKSDDNEGKTIVTGEKGEVKEGGGLELVSSYGGDNSGGKTEDKDGKEVDDGKKGGSKGDPLIQAFDGTLFFFHGEPGRIYDFASVADGFQVGSPGKPHELLLSSPAHS